MYKIDLGGGGQKSFTRTDPNTNFLKNKKKMIMYKIDRRGTG